ncbi:MAG: substrate-binding domain-containing protein, partial [Pseudomonadota bacterium]
GRRGDAAALLTHDRAGEEEFVANQHGIDRRDVMFNDFVLIGPADDPAGVLGSTTTDEAFNRLASSEVPFISRGDDSGTHRKELRLWEQAKIEIGAASDWYVEAGSGMGQTLITTMEIGGYTLSDRATWAKFSNKDDYIIAFEQSPPLFNPYSSILVYNSALSDEQLDIAKQWHEWLTSPVGQKAIEDYRFEGQQLFFVGTPVSPG